MMKSLCAGSLALALVGCGNGDTMKEAFVESTDSALYGSLEAECNKVSLVMFTENNKVSGYWPTNAIYRDPETGAAIPTRFSDIANCLGTNRYLEFLCSDPSQPFSCGRDIRSLNCSGTVWVQFIVYGGPYETACDAYLHPVLGVRWGHN